MIQAQAFSEIQAQGQFQNRITSLYFTSKTYGKEAFHKSSHILEKGLHWGAKALKGSDSFGENFGLMDNYFIKGVHMEISF